MENIEIKTEEKEPIEFNYFYTQFLRDLPKIKLERARNRISQDESDPEDLYFYAFMERLPQEEELEIYNQNLRNICNDYIVLADAKIDIIPSDLIDFINLILDTMEENPYSKSFLQSLQFIYQEYFSLTIGYPSLWRKDDEKKEPCIEVVLDPNHRLTELASINMDFLEQDKIMTKMVSMVIKQQTATIFNPEEYKPSKIIIKKWGEE